MRLLVAFSLFLLLWAVITDARKGKGYSRPTDGEEGPTVGGVQELPEDHGDENFPLRRPKGNKRGKGPNNRRTPENDQEGTHSPVESPPEERPMPVENRRQGRLNRTTSARGRPPRPERGQDRDNKGNRRTNTTRDESEEGNPMDEPGARREGRRRGDRRGNDESVRHPDRATRKERNNTDDIVTEWQVNDNVDNSYHNNRRNGKLGGRPRKERHEMEDSTDSDNTEDGNTEQQNHRRGNEERGGRRERPHRDHRNRTRGEHPDRGERYEWDDFIGSNNTEVIQGRRREERPNRRYGEGKHDGKRERPDRNHRNRTRAEHSDRGELYKGDDLIDSNKTEVATTDGQMEENPERPHNRHEGRHRNGKMERPERHYRNRTRGEQSERKEQPGRADRLGRLHDRNRTRDRDTPRRHRDHPDVSDHSQGRNRTTAGQRDRPGRPERRRGRLNGTRGEETKGLDMPTASGNITEEEIEMMEESDMAERRRERPDRNRTRGEERRRPLRPDRPARNRTRAAERPERRRDRPKAQDRQPSSPSGHNTTDDTVIRGTDVRPDRRRNNRTREDQKSRQQRPDRHRKHEEGHSAGFLQENGRFSSCEFGEWTKWSECQAFLQMRTRDVISGARNCSRRSREYRNCD